MTIYINLQFNDGDEILLSTSSFLFKRSKLFQSFDIEEDNNIPIICSKTYVTENNACLFDDKTNLSFIFMLQPNNFLDICKFLDIICYENEDILFSTQFIKYVMANIKEEINIIRYFMQPEIRSIMKYINNENADIQIKSCTFTFYVLYLTEYKEEVIIHNRIDIYEYVQNKDEYYRYIHKYNNHTTQYVKETQEYNNYIERINNRLLNECNNTSDILEIKELIEQGADVNFHDNGYSILYSATRYANNIEVIKLLVENGANINIYCYGRLLLHIASCLHNNIIVIDYLIKHGANINLQDNYSRSALHYAIYNNNLEVIKYLTENGINVNLLDNSGKSALHYAIQQNNNEVINYLQSIH